MTEHERLKYLWADELTDKEAHFIGKCVAHWGAIEHEVFFQVLQSFDQPGVTRDAPPKELRKVHFADVLKLWKDRVIDREQDVSKQVLQAQLDEILELQEARHALVHSMLTWGSGDLGEIRAMRARDNQLITMSFKADDLVDLYKRLAAVNFNIRYPGGRDEWAAEASKQGYHVSRRGLSLFTGHEISDDWLGGPLGRAKPNAADGEVDA